MLLLLKRDKDKLLTIVADCLRILALNHAPTKEIILMEGGTSRLVQIMLENEYRNLQKYVTRLLKGRNVYHMSLIIFHAPFLEVHFLNR